MEGTRLTRMEDLQKRQEGFEDLMSACKMRGGLFLLEPYHMNSHWRKGFGKDICMRGKSYRLVLEDWGSGLDSLNQSLFTFLCLLFHMDKVRPMSKDTQGTIIWSSRVNLPLGLCWLLGYNLSAIKTSSYSPKWYLEGDIKAGGGRGSCMCFSS